MSTKGNITIIGAGMSGLACAVALAKSPICRKQTIRVFQQGADKTGRISTTKLSGDCAIDLGAGRYSPQLHPHVHYLIKYFSKDVEVFPFTKQMIPYNALSVIKQTLARLKKVLPNHPDDSFFDLLCMYKGEKEATQIIKALGYNTLYLSNISAAMGFDIIETHPETQAFSSNSGNEWFNIVDGFGALANSMRDAAETEGVEFIQDHRLVSVNPSKQTISLTFEHHGTKVSHSAHKAVLALPPSAMESLNVGFPEAWSDHRYSSLPLFKGFLYYEAPWWHKYHLQDRVLVADNPMSKIYFKSDKYIFFYADSDNADYWQHCIAHSDTCYLERVRKYLAQALHLDVGAICLPAKHIYKYWPKGVEFSLDMSAPHPQALAKPEEGLFACSDAYTSRCGWIEGSLLSAQSATSMLLEGIKTQSVPHLSEPAGYDGWQPIPDAALVV